MTTPRTVSSIDNAKIKWACARYDFWLDLNSVPRKQRRALRAELKSNLVEASADVGLQTALANLGSLRALASATIRDGQLRSRWLAGWVAALSAFAGLIVLFLFLTLYYTDGVLDAGATEPVTSGLFPYLGSTVTVDPTAGGLAWSVEPGPIPLVAALIVWTLVAKPWRGIRSKSPADIGAS